MASLLGTWRRDLPIPLPRLFENLLDWEHLPHVHRTTYRSVTLTEEGPWGWRAVAGLAAPRVAESIGLSLVLDRERRSWVVTIESGARAGHRIETVATETAGGVTVELAFVAPEAPRNEAVRRALLHFFVVEWTRLYDEDLATMVHREQALADRREGRADAAAGRSLGTIDEVRRSLPLLVRWHGTRYRVEERGGEWLVYAVDCPHRLGPLEAGERDGDTVTCPWHGYRFDVRTGASLDGRCSGLPPAPRLSVAGGVVRLGPP